MKLAIDFGTVFSCIQVALGGLIRDVFEGHLGIPTLFMHKADTNEDWFGRQCEDNFYIMDHQKDIIRNIKTLVRFNPENLDNPRAVLSGGKYYSYRDIVKLILNNLIERAIEKGKAISGDPNDYLESICVTVPVAADASHMLSTEYRSLIFETVKEITGLDDDSIFILEEPVAAALYYCGKQEKVENENILVFDLGGGTLDVTILSYSKEENRRPRAIVKRIDGDPDLGGNLWDEALGRFVAEKCGLNPDMLPFTDEEKYEYNSKIRNLKVLLSKTKKDVFGFQCADEPYGTLVTLDEFEKATLHLRDRAMGLTKKVVDSFDGGVDAIDKILLVGGSSNMPQIKKGIEETFPTFNKENILLFEPSKAIAKGACMYTLIEDLGTQTTKLDITTVSSATYGWASRNGKKGRHMIYNSIFKESPFEGDEIISNAKDIFTPLSDTQTAVRFVVYESGARRSDCDAEGWIDFNSDLNRTGLEIEVPIPEKYLGKACQYKMHVTLKLNKNGILIIQVSDLDGAVAENQCKLRRAG